VAASSLRCNTCDALRDDPYPFRCVNLGSDGGDHVLTRALDTAGLTMAAPDDPNPFIAYRNLLHSYRWATAHGLTDAAWIDLAGGLDRAVAGVAGTSLGGTPLRHEPELGGGSQDTWVKDETGQPGGSHKVRHLFGTMLHLQAAEAVGAPPVDGPLAIASCGNAALAAAVIACAVQRELVVFVPEWADGNVTARLRDLGATLEVCRRVPEQAGDPCVVRFRDAVQRGAVPFSCQGPDNALALDGSRTLAWEIVTGLGSLDQVFVQVGGGALASGLVQGLQEAVALGAMGRCPETRAVQAEGDFPIVRAYERFEARAASGSLDDAVRYAASHRGEFMWPWETEPASIATGILDDEVYDWLAIVHGMYVSGGSPVVVDDACLRDAQERAIAVTGIPVSVTGSAGLAGLLATGTERADGPSEPRIVVLFTG
jgi:threonine synthase